MTLSSIIGFTALATSLHLQFEKNILFKNDDKEKLDVMIL